MLLPFSANTTPDSFHRNVNSREHSPHNQNDSINRFSGRGNGNFATPKIYERIITARICAFMNHGTE
jgi:hypothetical protein